MSRPAPDARSLPAPGDLEDVWIIHSSLTTQLHREVAINAYDAFGTWCRRHGLTGRVLAGQKVRAPIEHLDLALETDAGSELHRVHVVRERLLHPDPTS